MNKRRIIKSLINKNINKINYFIKKICILKNKLKITTKFHQWVIFPHLKQFFQLQKKIQMDK